MFKPLLIFTILIFLGFLVQAQNFYFSYNLGLGLSSICSENDDFGLQLMHLDRGQYVYKTETSIYSPVIKDYVSNNVGAKHTSLFFYLSHTILLEFE